MIRKGSEDASAGAAPVEAWISKSAGGLHVFRPGWGKAAIDNVMDDHRLPVWYSGPKRQSGITGAVIFGRSIPGVSVRPWGRVDPLAREFQNQGRRSGIKLLTAQLCPTALSNHCN